MVKNLILSTALCGILLGGVAWAESEDVQVKERTKEVYKEDGTEVESTSKRKTEVKSDDSGAASSTETRTESSTVECTDGETFNKETGKCE